MVLATLAIISILALTGCGTRQEEAVAKVNGQVISKADFDRNFDIYRRTYEEQFGPEVMNQDAGDGRTFEEAIKENILEKLITEEVIVQVAQKNNITVSDEELTEEIDGYKKLLGSKENFEQFLKANNFTEDYFREGLKREMIMQEYKQSVVDEMTFSDEEIKSFYTENIHLYTEVEASHILVKTEEEAKEILEEIKAGGDFEQLTARSIEPNAAERKGYLGYFRTGRMIEDFERAAFALSPGEISDLVQTRHGYHIIKVTDKNIDEFEDVKEDVLTKMQDQRYWNNHVEELREDAKIEIFIKNKK